MGTEGVIVGAVENGEGRSEKSEDQDEDIHTCYIYKLLKHKISHCRTSRNRGSFQATDQLSSGTLKSLL